MKVETSDVTGFSFLTGGGEMGKILRLQNWKATSLGGPAHWSQSLKNSLNTVLNSNFPSLLLWGSNHICFYNDSFRLCIDVDSDSFSLFGQSGSSLFSENLPVSKKVLDEILSEKKITHREDWVVPLLIGAKRQNVDWTFHYNAVYDDNGKPCGVLVSCNDITETEKCISRLRILDQQFQGLIHQATIGIIVLMGEEMRVEVVNGMYGKLIGRTVEELLGKNLFELIPEAESDFRPIIDRVRKTGEPLFLYDKHYFAFAKGEKIEGYLNLVYQPYRGHNGTISGVMVLCHDVTDQVRNKKTIIAAEEKAQLAIESADLGTYEIDLVTDKMRTSERFNTIWGVEKNITRAHLASRIHPDDLEMRAAAHRESLRTGNLHYEARVIHNDGSHHWVKVKGHVSYDNAGKPLMLLGVIQDITEQKTLAYDLTKLVQKRTEELQALNEELVATNEELIESNSHFTRVNKELEQFAYVASHDLQEPLRKIHVFTNILNQKFSDELSPNAGIYMEKIAASASRMSNLIKDLLDYSRLSYNTSLFRETDLNVIVNHVINDFELLISQKGITINVDPLPSLEAIPIQMNQLLYNLIGNSIKFSKKTIKALITITCRVLPAEETKQYPSLKINKEYLEVKLSDNGIGFSQQYAEQIFTIFQRLNNNSKYGGYGIGLALCRRIIENHNGIIFANGTENEGATFVFVLPIKH